MTVFDEIKQKMHEAIDKAVDALHSTNDLEAARPIAQATTQALHAQTLQVEAQLIKHVADNAAEAEKTETAPAGDSTTAPAAPSDTAPAADAKAKTAAKAK